MQLKWPSIPELMAMPKGSSTRIPRTPLSSVLLLIVTFELPPNKRIVPELVELILTFPVIEDNDGLARTILSGVSPTNSLLEMGRLDCAVLSNTEVLA